MSRYKLRIIRILEGGAAVAIVAAVALFIRFWPDDQGRTVPWGERIDPAVLPEFQGALLERDQMVLFEGLPHQESEAELLAAELKRQATIERYGFPFYSEAIPLSPADAETLANALARKSGIVEWGGLKLCGPFHPDFALRWSDTRGAVYDALICFGCEEIKLYGSDSRLYADLGEEAVPVLKETLGRYGIRRPVPTSGPGTAE